MLSGWFRKHFDSFASSNIIQYLIGLHMPRHLVAITLCIVCALTYAAGPPKLDIYSVEPGTCGSWRKIATNPRARQAQYFWFLGFLSGNNFALPDQQVPLQRLLNEVDFESYVTRKCNESAKYTITIIAMEFVEQNSSPASKASHK